MNARWAAPVVLVFMMFSAGCGEQTPRAEVAPERAQGGGVDQDGGPHIDWSAPLTDAVDAAPSVAAIAAASPLSFRPLLPTLGGKVTRVQVSNPKIVAPQDRAIGVVLRFPTGADFPVDGRVFIEQTATTDTEASLDADAATNSLPAGVMHLVQLGTQNGLMIEANGIGRVAFIKSGVRYDLTGPAVSPRMALQLARALLESIR